MLFDDRDPLGVSGLRPGKYTVQVEQASSGDWSTVLASLKFKADGESGVAGQRLNSQLEEDANRRKKAVSYGLNRVVNDPLVSRLEDVYSLGLVESGVRFAVSVTVPPYRIFNDGRGPAAGKYIFTRQENPCQETVQIAEMYFIVAVAKPGRMPTQLREVALQRLQKWITKEQNAKYEALQTFASMWYLSDLTFGEQRTIELYVA